MEIKNQIKKVAIAGLTVGALVMAGLTTAGVASADSITDSPEIAPNGPVSPVPHPPIFYSPLRYVRPVQYVTYPATYYVNYNYTNYAAIQGTNLWITNTAEVINVPPAVVVAELNQNKTLMQIAAERGWLRQYFLAGLINRAQANVAFAANHGAVNGVFANNLINSIPGQANYLIDRPGLR